MDRGRDHRQQRVVGRAAFRSGVPREFEVWSQSRFEAEVKDALLSHAELDSSGIEIEFDRSEVTLKGVVGTLEAQWLAEDAVQSVPGVHTVHNQLRVLGSDAAEPVD